MNLILNSSEQIERLVQLGGGKAANMARLSQAGFPVPEWFCVSADALEQFIRQNGLAAHLQPKGELKIFAAQVEKLFLLGKLPQELEAQIAARLQELGLTDQFVAVRSSGLEEDSAENSFAGQFSSFLFQKGMAQITQSLKLCWASGFSERALAYRQERGLKLTDIRIGVVIQKMVNADAAGVAFSRNPIRALDRENMVISSVWGLGEGLVSGELDADHYEVERSSLAVKHQSLAEKTHAFRQALAGGLVKKDVASPEQKSSSLSEEQLREVARLSLSLEAHLGSPQDAEWAFENGKLYFVQTRPVTSLPRERFYDPQCVGDHPILWDNSNIIESYNGVTSPLTFSFASIAYRQVYIQFCEVMGVSKEVVQENEPVFRNMLGLIRGCLYYNLVHWYKLVLLLPGAGSNKGFMETMMGVKQNLKPELARIFDELKPQHYSLRKKFTIYAFTLYRFLRIDSIVRGFQRHFSQVYEGARKLPIDSMSLTDLSKLYQRLDDQILRRWQAPIINDYLCMIFFGLLKKLTESWVRETGGGSLQNDLLCGQGDLESTEPTKMLMRIADRVDHGDAAIREWILTRKPAEIWQDLRAGHAPEINALVLEFLDKYGFRCVNELKLEEPDLHDDPSFVISAIASYVRMKAYDVSAMEEKEQAIRIKAEATVRGKLSGVRKPVYFFVLRQARKAVRNRENLRFARTKIFGVVRHIFRGMGKRLAELGVLAEAHDIFYLTVDEIFAYIEGRSVSLNLGRMVEIRKDEYAKFRKTPPPPDRFMSQGAASVWASYPQVLADADLMKNEAPASDDPNVLIGTPCCPGVVEGIVRVVERLEDAQGLNGEILVTARTDPGWVPLYPSSSGLLIERGSLLSHSAVVARELGLPTIVGISGGLMKKLKTGQRVRVDAAKGEVRILE